MPSDITGTEVIQEDKSTGQRGFKFLHGPIFANIILADEINRTPPKTQAALLEAMQERQVTAGGTRHRLPDPFFVLATQNPIEQEGTYPLPEAQLDRFLFKIFVDYPEEEEEYRIVEATTSMLKPQIEPVLTAADIMEMQDIVRRVPVAPYVIRYAMKFTRLTRKRAAAVRAAEAPEGHHAESADLPDFIREYVTWGAGPRASQYLVLGARPAPFCMAGITFPARTSAPWPLRCFASHHHQLQCRSRGNQAGRYRPPSRCYHSRDPNETAWQGPAWSGEKKH